MKKFVWLLIFFGIGVGLGWKVMGKSEKTSESNDFETNQTPSKKPNIIANRKDATMEAKLRNYVASLQGNYAVAVWRLRDNKGYGINMSQVLPARSMIKIPVMVATIEEIKNNNLNWDQLITLQDQDLDSQSGPLYQFGAGAQFSVDRLLLEMGTKSDMTAQGAIRRTLGIDKVNKAISDLGMKDTNYNEGTSTVEDMVSAWKTIYSKYNGNGEIWDRLSGYLSESIYEDGMPAGLPLGTKLMHKVGTDIDIWNDGGIVFPEGKDPFVLVIMNDGVDLDQAQKAVPEITKIVWDYETS